MKFHMFYTDIRVKMFMMKFVFSNPITHPKILQVVMFVQ